MSSKVKMYFVLVFVLLISSSVISLTVGGSSIGVSHIINLITNPEEVQEVVKIIILEIRLPRLVGGIVVGALLAVSGTLIKAVMRNPLADTGLLGIQSGASLTAIIVILIFPTMIKFLPIFAFIGGVIAYLILVTLAYKDGINPIRLVLAGVAVNALFGALMGIINMYNAENIQNTLTWLNGSLAGVTVSEAKLLVVYGVIGLVIALFTIPKCNLLALDDLTIINLGENLTLTRFIIASVSVFLSAISVSMVGVIGFVGLVIPHISRMMVGTNHKYMMPFSMILGSLFVVLADTLQIIIFAPIEMPVSIIISLVGAPFFLYLLRKQSI